MFIIIIIEVTFPTVPHTEVTEKGKIEYSEVVRENLKHMLRGDGQWGHCLRHSKHPKGSR